MSRSSRVLVLASMLLAASISTARGQVQISFDENGHGMGPAGPLPFGVNTSPPLAFQTLFYVLPFQVAPGDLLLFENPQHTLVSDMIRFSGNQVFFFSDKEPGETNPDLADVDLIPNPTVGFVSLDETPFTEGNNGAVYTPVAGGPGDPGFPVQYTIISDAVPEPRTFALAALGGVLLFLALGRKAGRTGGESKRNRPHSCPLIAGITAGAFLALGAADGLVPLSAWIATAVA